MAEKERERAMTEYDRGYLDAYFRYKPQGDVLKRALDLYLNPVDWRPKTEEEKRGEGEAALAVVAA